MHRRPPPASVIVPVGIGLVSPLRRRSMKVVKAASLAVKWWDFWRHGLKRPLGNCLEWLRIVAAGFGA